MDNKTRNFSLGMVAILVFAALTYCALAAFWPKFSRAEVFFAECAREMIEAHNFVTPLYHKQPFFDKPILVYWLIISMFKTCGLSHFAARVPSIISALGVIILTGWGSAALFGRRAGLIAAAALATSFMFLSFASLAMSDMLLVFFDTLTLSLLYAGLSLKKNRTSYWCLAAASMGFAFLTKGPIGIVLPAFAFFVFLAITKQLNVLRPKYFIFAALIMILIASPWFIAAYRANGLSALIYFFIHENLQRFAGDTYDAGKPFWYMITSFVSGFAPWSIFLLFALGKQITNWLKRTEQDPAMLQIEESDFTSATQFLWLWVFIAVGFFCFSRGKCDYYALPAYPAAAMLVGNYLNEQFEKGTKLVKAILLIFAAIFILGSLGSIFILPAIVTASSARDCPGDWLGMPIVLALTGIVMLILLLKNKLQASYFISAAGVCAAVILFSAQIFPAISAMEPIEKYAKLINKFPNQNLVIGVDHPLRSWVDEISFQTGKHPVVLNDTDNLDEFLNQPNPTIVLIWENKLNILPDNIRSKLNILTKDHVITHSLTPGYAIEHRGKLTDPIPVVLITNGKI